MERPTPGQDVDSKEGEGDRIQSKTGMDSPATTPDSNDGDADSSDIDADTSTTAFSRRDLLRSGVGASVVSATAGCTSGFEVPDFTSYSFTAGPVVLASDPEGVDYEKVTETDETITRNPSVGGAGIEVELTNHATVYESTADTLGLLSSPAAEVATRPVNPLATDSMREILTGEVGDVLLRNLGVVEQSTVSWTRGPEQVGAGEGELLGQTTEIRSFAGVTEQSGFVLLTAARVTDAGDAVIVANVQKRDGDAEALVGANGYVSREVVDGSVGRLAETLPHVKREFTGVELSESARLEMEDGKPGYVSVLLENTYDERSLHSITLMSQFFDAEGALLDVGTAGVPMLRPGETFEAYLPYFTDGVAGYAVEAQPSTRERPDEPPENVEVASQSRDGDEVTALVRNTAAKPAPFVDLAVTFYDEDGNVLGTQHRHINGLGENERREFRTAYAPATTDPAVTVGDYAVELVRYGDSVLYVR